MTLLYNIFMWFSLVCQAEIEFSALASSLVQRRKSRHGAVAGFQKRFSRKSFYAST